MNERQGSTKPVITLFQPRPALGLAGSMSPACMKLETWLRIAAVPYETRPPFMPGKAPPKGKIPYIEDNGVLIGDSTLIVEHLKRTRNVDPDEGLSPAERAISLAFRRMLKEHTYWVIMHVRYKDQASWDVYRGALRAQLLPPGAPAEAAAQADAMVDGIRKRVLEQMQAHGIGLHTDEEIHQLGGQDVTAVSDFLGDKPFFFGDRPTSADATVYAYLAQLLDPPFDSPTRRVARGRTNLVDYCARMRARFFPG